MLMQAKNAVGSNTPGAASSAADLDAQRLQNRVQNLEKSMSKMCCFLTSTFWGIGLDFGASWASKSAALLAAPGVLDPTAFYACINILH